MAYGMSMPHKQGQAFPIFRTALVIFVPGKQQHSDDEESISGSTCPSICRHIRHQGSSYLFVCQKTTIKTTLAPCAPLTTTATQTRALPIPLRSAESTRSIFRCHVQCCHSMEFFAALFRIPIGNYRNRKKEGAPNEQQFILFRIFPPRWAPPGR